MVVPSIGQSFRSSGSFSESVGRSEVPMIAWQLLHYKREREIERDSFSGTRLLCRVPERTRDMCARHRDKGIWLKIQEGREEKGSAIELNSTVVNH